MAVSLSSSHLLSMLVSVRKQGSGGIWQVYLIPGSVTMQLMVRVRRFHCLCSSWCIGQRRGRLFKWCDVYCFCRLLRDSYSTPALSNLSSVLPGINTHLCGLKWCLLLLLLSSCNPKNWDRGTRSSHKCAVSSPAILCHVVSKGKCLHLYGIAQAGVFCSFLSPLFSTLHLFLDICSSQSLWIPFLCL